MKLSMNLSGLSANLEDLIDSTSDIFRFGPDIKDLRQQRPYYLVPLLNLDKGQQQRKKIKEEILGNLRRQAEPNSKITDIYVFSHGWHRNLFSGVAAYDRIFSRFLMLLRRGRIEPEAPFSPLFIAMHWHSDPGQDAWVDKNGRRVKASFMENIQQVFEPREDLARFLNDFEEIYELFSKISAPDTLFLDSESDPQVKTLTEKLETYGLRGVLHDPQIDRNTTLPGEKAMLAWRCYQEAQAKRLLIDQGDRPKRFNNPFLALSTLFKFVVSGFGLVTLLSLLFTHTAKILPKLPGWYKHDWPNLLEHVNHQPTYIIPLNYLMNGADALVKWIVCAFHSAACWISQSVFHIYQKPPLLAEIFLGLVVIPLFTLVVSIAWFQIFKKFRSSGVPLIATVSWVPLQLVLSIPILLIAVSTFIFRTWLILLVPLLAVLGLPRLAQVLFWLCVLIIILAQFWQHRTPGLFSERHEEKKLNSFFQQVGGKGREWFAAMARWPISGLRHALAKDSSVNGVVDAIENQLAFFEMQRKGVKAGREASYFMEEILAEDSRLAAAFRLPVARVHLIGHSFGGLLVVNLARSLKGPVQTLCLLQAAIASAWFEGENELCHRIKGTIACVYSGYDMANGFYYPLANGGQLAAGYVGLCNLPSSKQGQPIILGKDGLFASLSEPPKLNDVIMKELKRLSPADPTAVWHQAVNLDASRLIYEGDPRSGGGHDDIFKDDVIHLIWAITQIAIKRETSTPSN